ncbi:MAG: hypothetical protein R2852_08250 [Bacteroidia bacterium]
MLSLGLFVSASAQLSGTYTLNTGAATGGTNYQSWADFRSDIVTNGVSAAVTLDVITDATSSQINLPAITGASSTNTITIKGNNKVLQAE